jgi:hypothetical protein
LARILDANVTAFVETANVTLPDRPQYSPSSHRLTGVEIGSGDIFNTTLDLTHPITEGDVEDINKGISKLYAFGLIRFTDSSGTTGCNAFIAFYNPKNDPRRGMFTLAGEDHKSYAICE